MSQSIKEVNQNAKHGAKKSSGLAHTQGQCSYDKEYVFKNRIMSVKIANLHLNGELFSW